jgi:copper chaperone
MTKKYLLIGVVTIAGLLMLTAILTANTRTTRQPNPVTLTDRTTGSNGTGSAQSAKSEIAAQNNMAKAVLDVQGMTCSGCIYNIKSGLADIEGIDDVLVDLNSGKVEVFYDSSRVTDLDQVASAITTAGYPATLSRTVTGDELARQNNAFAARSKLYIAAVGDWEISREDFNNELSHARNRYKKVYGSDVFTGERGNTLDERLQSQVASNLISEGIQMQEIGKAGYRLPRPVIEAEFRNYLEKRNMSQAQFRQALKDAGYDYDYFLKKFENRLTIDHYVNEEVLSGLTSDLDKRQRYGSWYNNAQLLAKVVYYDKDLERAVKNNSAGGGCGGSCSAKQ